MSISFKTRNSLHWIGLVFININNPKNINPQLNQFNITNILVNRKNYFPTIRIEYSKDFKFKKHIRQYILQEYQLKKKYIEDIRFISSYKKIHSYLIIVKKTKYLYESSCVSNLSLNSEYFAWRPFINFLRKDISSIDRKNIYKYLYLNSLDLKIPNYKILSSKVYHNQYSISFQEILLLISNLESIPN